MNNNNQRAGIVATFKRKILASAITFAYVSFAAAPAYASDTEIYTKIDTSIPISPTLMMMFDTSGSMDWCVYATSPANRSCAVTADKRINVLKKAMKQILRGDAVASPAVSAAPGYIKMGLSRYHATSDKGGYVMYPARPLDAFVSINPNGYITDVALTGNADGVQATTQALTGTQLAIGSNGSTNNAAGFQFSVLTIPKGAAVSRAYIEVKAAVTQAGSARWKIEAEDSDSAAEYSAGSTIAARSYTAPPTGSYFEPEAWTAGTKYRIDVTDAVNGVVNRAGWCGDNNLAIRISNIDVAGVTPTQRTAYSYEGAPTAEDRPTLVVEYLANTESTTSCMLVPRTTVVSLSNNEDDVMWGSTNTGTKALQGDTKLTFNKITSSVVNTVGLRYRNVSIPLNAAIDSAYLKVKAAVGDTNVQSTSVTAFSSSNLPVFCSSTSASSCSTDTTLNALPVHTITSSEATWRPSSNTIVLDRVYAIPVTEAVKKVTQTSGWASGNALGFKLKNAGSTNNSNAAFYSRNSSSSKAVQLEINWRERITDLRGVVTVRDELETAVAGLGIPSSTPLGAAYAEAARYLYGMTPKNTGGAPLDYDSRVVNTSVAGATGLKYVSPIPIEDKCSANYIFLLTDGEPTVDAAVKENVDGIIGSGSCTTASGTSGTAISAKNWDCMKKLATYSKADTNRLGKPILTNTVILGPEAGAITNMRAVAAAGGGEFYNASDTAALVNAITRTIEAATNRSGTLAAPGVAVNQINRLNHLNQLYYAVFEPDVTYRWNGNLKRYKLSGDGETILDNSPTPVNAVDPETGLFKDGTQSFWSTTPDGAVATAGGAASQLPNPADRKMYTFLGALTSTNTALSPITFGEPFNTNAKAKMGITDDTIYKNLINWYKGYAITDLSSTATAATPTGESQLIGAALHSQPVLVNYGYTLPTGATLAAADDPDNQTNILFFSTMGGTLHAINANNGQEVFSFIPGEKLNTLKAQFDNQVQELSEFGMDSTWTYYRKDANFNGQIDSGDNVYLYGGMRMGGKNYYALDMSTVTTTAGVPSFPSPKLLFAIQGGTGSFVGMGETWSQPVVATIKLNGVKRTVLVFGGGHDPRHDTAANTIFSGTDAGNQLYIVDAFTGALIWSASGDAADGATLTVADMKFSVPSQPKVMDFNGDGFADTIYFGDMGGQVFRVDLKTTGTSSDTLVKRVKLVAKLGQTGVASPTVADQRRFYEPPEVVRFKDTAGKYFMSVSIGSGYRDHPLNVLTDDNFFVLFDYDPVRSDLLTLTAAEEAAAATALQPVITKADLATLNQTSSAATTVSSTQKGWFLDFLDSGEKSLASGLVFQNRLIFSTYVPSAGTTGASTCTPVTGKSKLYSMCMPYGDTCGAAGVTDRVVNPNVMSGISGRSQVMILPDPNGGDGFKKGLLTGTDSDGQLLNNPSDPTIVPTLLQLQRWHEKTRNPSN